MFLATDVDKTKTIVHLQTRNVRTVSNSGISLACIPCIERSEDGCCHFLSQTGSRESESADGFNNFTSSLWTIDNIIVMLGSAVIGNLTVLNTEPQALTCCPVVLTAHVRSLQRVDLSKALSNQVSLAHVLEVDSLINSKLSVVLEGNRCLAETV